MDAVIRIMHYISDHNQHFVCTLLLTRRKTLLFEILSILSLLSLQPGKRGDRGFCSQVTEVAALVLEMAEETFVIARCPRSSMLFKLLS